MSGKHLYEFGPFRLDPVERRLLRDGEPVPLTPRCFDLLVVLVENSGHLLGKRELLERLWPGQFVEESNLSFNVSSLRKALGEGRDGQRFIETVPKKGFRFVAPVEEGRDDRPSLTAGGREGATRWAEGEQPPDAFRPTAWRRFPPGLKILVAVVAVGALTALAYDWWARRAATPIHQPHRTIAVLPFKPLDTESRDESLEMGVAATLVTKLGSVRRLVVRPINSTRKYTDPGQDPVEAGRELRADVVLDGSIQKAGDRVRITARLTEVESGMALWAAQFDENLTHIFIMQDAIAERVAQALTLRLNPEERARLTRHYTENPEAYQLYLQGNYFFSKQTGDRAYNFGKSLEYYQQAVERDPKFARAYVGIAEFFISAGNNLPQWERSPQARAAVVKALELDDTLAEAHTALAELKYQYEFDWSGAGEDFKRAIDLNPNDAYIRLAHSWYHMCLGRFDRAQAELERAQELEPGSLRINKTQGVLLLFMRQYDEAISHYRKMREVEPTLIHRNQWSMSVAYEQTGRHAEAVEEFLEDGRIREFLTPEESLELREAFRASGWEGYVRMRIELLEGKAKGEYVPPTTLAGIYALAGEKDSAIAWLEKAVDTRDPWCSLIKIQPAYDSLRQDPRFTRLLQRVNLTP